MGFSALAPFRATVAAIGLATLASPPVAAQTAPYFLSFTTTMSQYSVEPVVMFESAVGTSGFGVTWPFHVPAGTSTITDPFEKLAPMQAVYLMGLTNLVPDGEEATGDEAPHLVLFTNNSFAAAAVGQSFETLFPNTSEAALIADLQEAFAVGSDPSDLRLEEAGERLGTFANMLGASDAIDGPYGSIAFVPGDAYSVMAFSSGQIIGTGLSSTTLAETPVDAPEPLSLALFASSLAGLAIIRRRRPSA